jgi:DNA-binding SARP family transcriptional activator
VRFGILGPVEVERDGRRVVITGRSQVGLLAFLLLHANQAVSTDRLIDELWADHAADGSVKRAQVAIARLRKLLGDKSGRDRAAAAAHGGRRLRARCGTR